MKLKFWQKAYVLTLAIFLLCLNAGILVVAVYTNTENENSAVSSAQIQQSYIATSFERDVADLYDSSNEETLIMLMSAYTEHYKNNDILLFFYSAEGEPYSSAQTGEIISKADSGYLEIEEKRHLIIRQTLCDGTLEMIFAKDVSSVDDRFVKITATCVGLSVAISAALAACLYFVLRKLSKPVEALKTVTQKVESGDLSARACEIGNDEIADLGRSFNRMVQRIDSQMDALEKDAVNKQRLVDDMAHEMRTPLTCIIGYADILEKANVDESSKAMAAKYISSEANRLQKISQILLDCAYIRENPPKTDTLSLSSLVKDTAERLSPLANKAKVALIVRSSEPVQVTASEPLLSMLIYNLAENAIKACKKGGEVILCTTGHTVEVADNGCGIDEDKIAYLTTPFYRTDKSRSRADGGAGLGLYLCQRIADIHGAKLTITSQKGKGTCVRIDFTS